MKIDLARLEHKILDIIETLKSPNFSLNESRAIGIYAAKTLDGTTHIGWNTPSSSTMIGDRFHFDHGVGINKNNDGIYLWVAPHNFKSALIRSNQAAVTALILRSIVPIGTEVEVLDPKDENTAHGASFTGTIDDFKEGYITVKDMDDSVWALELDDIDSIPLSQILSLEDRPSLYRNVTHEDCLSILIPCTNKQADMAIDALCNATDGVVFKGGEDFQSAIIFRELLLNHPDNKNAEKLAKSLNWNIDAAVVKDGLLISPKTTEPNAHFLIFAQAVQKAYAINDIFEYIVPNVGEPHSYLSEPCRVKYDSFEACIKEMCERVVSVSNEDQKQRSDEESIQKTPTGISLTPSQHKTILNIYTQLLSSKIGTCLTIPEKGLGITLMQAPHFNDPLDALLVIPLSEINKPEYPRFATFERIKNTYRYGGDEEEMFGLKWPEGLRLVDSLTSTLPEFISMQIPHYQDWLAEFWRYDAGMDKDKIKNLIPQIKEGTYHDLLTHCRFEVATKYVLHNAPAVPATTYTVTTYDDQGTPNGSKQIQLTQAQVQDIIDHAAQFVASAQDGDVYAELENALLVADVLNDVPSISLSMQN